MCKRLNFGLVSCSCCRIHGVVKEEMMWAIKSSILARGIGHDILPEKMGIERDAFHSHS